MYDLITNLGLYLDAKFVVPKEAQAFLDPIRDEYEELKSRHLDKNYFLDDKGIKGAFSRARMLGLHQTKGLKILDIGTGPAMFPAVCKHYGHNAIGGDVPAHQEGSERFGGSAKILNMTVKPLIIKSPHSLPENFTEKYDLITGFLSNFDNGWEDQGPWSPEDWKIFINVLFDKYLLPGGRACFLPVKPRNSEAFAAAVTAFSNVREIRRWGVWILTKPN